MTALQVMKSEYEGHEISFNEEGWFNATQAAAKYGKRPNDWLAIHATKEYLAALKECMGISEDSSLVMARRGRNTSGNGNNSGTWMHPKLGVAFARWLDVRFAVWCDLQIDTILRGKVDQKRLRSEAASSFKVMAAVLQLTRDDGWFDGARLSTIIGEGTKAPTFSHPVASVRIIPLPDWWQGYIKGGKCWIDPEHSLYMDKERWQLSEDGNTRTCRWCGEHRQYKHNKMVPHEYWSTT